MKKIDELIKNGESGTSEFKKSFGNDVVESAVALANNRGGTILIGVDDAGKIVGQSFGKEALRDYVNRIAVATEPSIIPDAERVSTPEGAVLVLFVAEFPLKPVATRGRCYRRSGSNTRQMTPSEIAEMHLHSTGQSMDAIIVPGKTIEDIDLDAVRRYMHRATEQGRRSFLNTEDPIQVLKKLELLRSEQEITRAAILLFGKNPQSPLTQAVVHAGRLREKVHIMDNRIVEGSIIDQVEETVEFIKKNLHVRFEITGAPQRKEIWDYPLPALREAVINAVVHRDYGDTADIQIKIFENILQVWSPGFLPYNVTVEDLLNPQHASKPRNKLIAQVFYDIGLIERYGSGIDRILEACQNAGLSQPVLENFSGGFRVKFAHQDEGVKPRTPQVTGEVTGEVAGEVTGEVLRLLNVMTGELKRSEIQTKLSLRHEDYFREKYLIPTMEAGLVERTVPDKPRSSKQKYRITEAGRKLLGASLQNQEPRN